MIRIKVIRIDKRLCLDTNVGGNTLYPTQNEFTAATEMAML